MANWNDGKFLKSVGVAADRETVDAEKECRRLRELVDYVNEQNKRLVCEIAELESNHPLTAFEARILFIVGLIAVAAMLAAFRYGVL